MKVTGFNTPGNSGDLAGNAVAAAKWSDHISQYFTRGVTRLSAQLAPGSAPQFYNPLTNGSTAPDVAGTAGVITWNGFPRKFLGVGPAAPPNFAGAEPQILGKERPQDEYLEWFTAKSAGKITSVQFTCEGWDYYEFLAKEAPDVLLGLYRTFISPSVQPGDLFVGGQYNRVNKWNTSMGAMHLTERANNLEAEVILGADATVRRKKGTQEVTSAIPLTRCSGFGDPARNSDPTIGAAVNGLARRGRMITLADPVGLYIDRLNESVFKLPDGSPATGWFRILRGSPTHILRAEFAPPAGSALTVSDVKVGGVALKFGGQIAQHITMKIIGVASVATGIANQLVPCAGAAGAGLAAAVSTATTRSGR